MMRSHPFLLLLAALLLFGPLTLFAAPGLNHAPKTTAHQASRRVQIGHFIGGHSRYRRGYSSRHHRAVLPAGPSSDRIQQIQGALTRAGYYKADTTGKWDGDTVAAMKRFQEAQGLSPTGKIDALTLQKLGLGSDTAGLGEPHPPPPAPNKTSSNH